MAAEMKCTWREKPGLPETCSVLPEAGATMCPRHKMLSEAANVKAEEKYRQSVTARKVKSPRRMPATLRELIEQGYQLTGSGSCRACDAHVEWWKTPNGRTAPYNPMGEGEMSPAVSHFATCPRADRFRRV